MSRKLRFLVGITIMALLIGTHPSSSALAGGDRAGRYQGAGETRLNLIKRNPCGTLTFYPGEVPIIACSGWAGAASWITAPLISWETNPPYPLVNYPFYIALGTVAVNGPGTNAYFSFPRSDVTYPQQIAIKGLRTEIKWIAVQPDLAGFSSDFNGVLTASWDDKVSISKGILLNRYFDSVEADLTLFDPPPVPGSATHLPYYELGPGTTDTVVLRAITTNSSYRAHHPATYRGEPAYRIEIDSCYRVQARVSWDSYRLWTPDLVGYQTICRPGTNDAGIYNCLTAVGQRGHTAEVPVYDWTWGAPIFPNEGVDFVWVDIASNITVDSVRWPDGSIHDHMPLVVYQSQPILQQP